MGQHALAPAKVWKSGGNRLEFRSPCRSKVVPDSNRRFATQRVDLVPNTLQESQHRSGAGFQHSVRSAKNEVNGTTLLPRALHQLKTLARRVEVLSTKRFQVRRLTNA